MNALIIDKLALVETDIVHGFSFVTGLKYYRFGSHFCIAGTLAGEERHDGLILFFTNKTINNKAHYIQVLVPEKFLLDSNLQTITLFINMALELKIC